MQKLGYENRYIIPHGSYLINLLVFFSWLGAQPGNPL